MANQQAEYAKKLLDIMAVEDYGTRAENLTIADLLDNLDAAGLAFIEAEGIAMMAYLKHLRESIDVESN